MTSLAPSHAPDSETLVEKIARRIDGISSLPHVAMKVMEVANKPEAGAADLKQILEGDPSLSARVLKCVNSSAYSLRSKVTNLQLAISYLGFKQIRNLAVTASVSDLFKTNEVLGTYSRKELWKHLVAVGVCARMIALRQRLPLFEDAFLAGLLHDIGIILEDQHMHASFTQVMTSLQANKTLSESEQDHLGFDHTMLGALIAERWRFPDSVQAAIRHHHGSANYRGEHVAIVRCVEVANLICTSKGMSSVGMNLLRANRASIDALGLSKEDLEVLVTDLDHELTLYSHLFTM